MRRAADSASSVQTFSDQDINGPNGVLRALRADGATPTSRSGPRTRSGQPSENDSHDRVLYCPVGFAGFCPRTAEGPFRSRRSLSILIWIISATRALALAAANSDGLDRRAGTSSCGRRLVPRRRRRDVLQGRPLFANVGRHLTLGQACALPETSLVGV